MGVATILVEPRPCKCVGSGKKLLMSTDIFVNVLDRIPCHRRTVLNEECLYYTLFSPRISSFKFQSDQKIFSHRNFQAKRWLAKMTLNSLLINKQ